MPQSAPKTWKSAENRRFRAIAREHPLAAELINAINRYGRRSAGVEWEHIEAALGEVRQYVTATRIQARDENGEPLGPAAWPL